MSQRPKLIPDPVDPLQLRLLADWLPGAWIGSLRRVIEPHTEVMPSPQGDIVDPRPAHWLVALWRPQRLQQPFLRRWPQVVELAAGDDERDALQALLRHVPYEERLLIVREDVDWALLAEIVMLSETHLRAFHYRALQQFIVDERAATSARISAAYSETADGYQRFAKTQPSRI